MVQVTRRLLQVSALVLLVGLTACQTPSGSFCAVSSPTRLSAPAIDAMTDGEVRDVLAHNRKGAALCGWKA